MRVWLPFFILVSPLLMHAQPAQDRSAPNCGLNSIKFDVNTAKTKVSVAAPDSAKGLVYFLEDDTMFESIPKPTVRLGVDGQWIGATHGNSWFSFSIDPGEHHLCANWQKRVVLIGPKNQVAAAHFIAKPGTTYYFRMQDEWNRAAGLSVNFAPVDSDEALILIQKFPISAFHAKK